MARKTKKQKQLEENRARKAAAAAAFAAAEAAAEAEDEDEDEAPPIEEAAAPPVDEAAAQPVVEVAAPPVEGAADPPVEESAVPLAEEAAVPPSANAAAADPSDVENAAPTGDPFIFDDDPVVADRPALPQVAGVGDSSILSAENAGEPIAAATTEIPSVDFNDDYCATCRKGGNLLCCAGCSLSFHLGCHRPQMDCFPTSDGWRCSFCIAFDYQLSRGKRTAASLYKDEMQAMGVNLSAKRSKATPDEKAKQFVEAFFANDTATQKRYLNALLTDGRVKEVMPVYASQRGPEQTEYNNELIDLTDPANFRPIDNTAFHWYTPNYESGRHRSLDSDNNTRRNFNIVSAANQARLRYANRIQDFVMGLDLSDEQRRSVLWKALCLPELSPMVKSFGLTTKSRDIGLLVATNVQRFIGYARTTAHRKGRGSDAQRRAVNTVMASLMQTPPRTTNGSQQSNSNTLDTGTQHNTMSGRQLLRLVGISEGSSHILRECGKFRQAAKDGLVTAFQFLGPSRNWQKVSPENWHRFRSEWLPNHGCVSDIPSKGETIFMREDGEIYNHFAIHWFTVFFTYKNESADKILRDDKGDPIITQKLVSHKPKTMMYVELLKSVPEGGFDAARDSHVNVMISETAMRRRWPNWVVPMTKRFKTMCVCDKCGVPMEGQESLNNKRINELNRLKDKLKRMRPGSRKYDELGTTIKKYEDDVMVNGKVKYDRMSKLIDEFTCPTVEIDGVSMHKFACAVGDCTVCKDNYQPLPYEANCVEKIKYNLYLGHRECTWHGDDGNIREGVDDKGRRTYECTLCEVMSEQEFERWLKIKKPARIKSSKYKTKYSLPLQEFVKKKGVYHDLLLKYRLHRFHRLFLGTKVSLKMIREFNKSLEFKSLMLQSDYSEKFEKLPYGLYQSQYFDRKASLSMEGYAATYYNVQKEKFVLNFYSGLSDERRQDGGTTAENMTRLLSDLFHEKKELVWNTLDTIISITDGCSSQYRSGSVCYELMLLAIAWGVPIDRVVQASGHGKCMVDSQSGLDKTLLALFFDCLTTNPEALLDGIWRVHTYERDENGLVSLAEICHEILSDPSRRYGSDSNSRRAAVRKIDERRYFIRPEGASSKVGVKFVCGKFPKGDGIRSNYHIRADPELAKKDERPNVIAIRRFPCFCKFCVKKMQEPIETRYSGASDTCIYWEVFKRADGKTGYNDWKLISLKPKPKEYVEEDDLDRIEVAVNDIGRRMSSQMVVGNIGAYIADDERYDYYLFKCTCEPKEADKDYIFERDGNEFPVKQGQLYCEGVWLDKVGDSSRWYTVTEQRCVVRLQVVVDADVPLEKWSDENPLPINLKRDVAIKAKEDGAMKIAHMEHAFLMVQARVRSSLDKTDTVYGSVLGDDGDGEQGDGDEQSDVEEEESDDE